MLWNPKIRYIDVHGHLDSADYDADREAVIARARDAGVGMVTVGTDLASSKRAVELAEAHEDMWAVVGMHPVDAGGDAFDPEAFRALAVHPKTVAIGECGFDFFHCKPDDVGRQRELFLRHIELANETGKPLMLHVRNAKDASSPSAYLEAARILEEKARVRANFHFFAGDLTELKAVLGTGASVSFTGAITFAKNYEEIVKAAPLERIMSETDCPYVAPAPNRGKRNEPAYVVEVVKALARIRGESEDEVALRLLENARDFFRI